MHSGDRWPARLGSGADRQLSDHLRLLDLNITGAVHLSRLLLPAMAERGRGGVLFRSSIAGSAKNRAQTAAAKVLPDRATAAVHGHLAAPGSGG